MGQTAISGRRIITKVKCWGNDAYGRTDVPPLSNPSAISLAISHSCALDGSQLKCWGGKYKSENKPEIPTLNHPTSLSVYGEHICVVDDLMGVKCWDEHGYTPTPESLPKPNLIPNLYFEDVPSYLGRVARFLPTKKANVINEATQHLLSLTKDSASDPATHSLELLTLNLLEPLLKETESQNIQKNIYPSYLKEMDRFRKHLRISGDEIPRSVNAKRLALRTAAYALRAIRKDVIDTSSQKLEEMIIGLATLEHSLGTTNTESAELETFFSKILRSSEFSTKPMKLDRLREC